MDYRLIPVSKRQAYQDLLLLADEDPAMLFRYVGLGEMVVAFDDETPVGSALVVGAGTTLELMNLAVAPAFQRRGIGSALIAWVLTHYAGRYQTLLVGTGDADADNLRFYRGNGFVECGRRKDFFLQYKDPIVVDGVALRDMVLLKQAVPVR